MGASGASFQIGHRLLVRAGLDDRSCRWRRPGNGQLERDGKEMGKTATGQGNFVMVSV